MKPRALLVNTSRASVIEEGALLDGLRTGRPGFAAVDVYEREPVTGAEHPLLKMKNVLCTPHLGYAEHGGYETMYRLAVDQILAYAESEPINVVNPESLRKRPS
jgi:D-3-phosphoglycerate dehydrogenase